MPPAVLAIALADALGLPVNLKRVAGLARGQQAECGLADVVKVAHRARPFGFVQVAADLLEEQNAAFEPQG